MCYEGEWCMVAGAVDKVVTSWMGIGLPVGAVEDPSASTSSRGACRWRSGATSRLGLRFRAAAMGVPFLPSLTMLGSSLVDVGGSKIIDCPYTGEKLLAVPALFPDVALLHVHRADRFGNCQIDGYPHMDADIARAAATVLVTAEEIVSEEEIRLHPDRTVIPGFAVDALVHVPYGSYPARVLRRSTTPSPTTSRTYVDGINRHGAAGVQAYLDRYVYGPATHAEYLALFGETALADAGRRGRELVT